MGKSITHISSISLDDLMEGLMSIGLPDAYRFQLSERNAVSLEVMADIYSKTYCSKPIKHLKITDDGLKDLTKNVVFYFTPAEGFKGVEMCDAFKNKYLEGSGDMPPFIVGNIYALHFYPQDPLKFNINNMLGDKPVYKLDDEGQRVTN